MLGGIHFMENPFQLPAFKIPVSFAFLWKSSLAFQLGKKKKNKPIPRQAAVQNTLSAATKQGFKLRNSGLLSHRCSS